MVMTAVGLQSSRMKRSLSALVEGLTMQNTAPVFSVANRPTTASQQLSAKMTTRSPRATPLAARVAARA